MFRITGAIVVLGVLGSTAPSLAFSLSKQKTGSRQKTGFGSPVEAIKRLLPRFATDRSFRKKIVWPVLKNVGKLEAPLSAKLVASVLVLAQMAGGLAMASQKSASSGEPHLWESITASGIMSIRATVNHTWGAGALTTVEVQESSSQGGPTGVWVQTKEVTDHNTVGRVLWTMGAEVSPWAIPKLTSTEQASPDSVYRW